MPRTVTMDFREEYEAERTRWLRRRFLWYSAVLSSYHLARAIVLLIWVFAGATDASREIAWLQFAIAAMLMAAFAAAFANARQHAMTREAVLRLVFWLTVGSGTIAILAEPLFVLIRSDGGLISSGSIRAAGLVGVFSAHFVASIFIPWSPRESLRPLIPLLAVFAVTTLLLGGGGAISRILFVLFSPVAGLPGLAICWWRYGRHRSRFLYRMIRGRYGELQRELGVARRVHESLFPEPVGEGRTHFQFRYFPMRQIGGDYLYATTTHRETAAGAEPLLSVVLIDVTGHGVAAALTVNRLYGELERIFAERPAIDPGEVLADLNNYVHLTLAKHSVYATALCMRVDSSKDVIEWANAGHPPAFLCTAAHRIERLDSTAPILGVLDHHDYVPAPQTHRFGPGDAVIAYTDGVTDVSNATGARFGIEGVQRVLAGARPSTDRSDALCEALVDAVETYRFGPAGDDILVVEVRRPMVATRERAAVSQAAEARQRV